MLQDRQWLATRLTFPANGKAVAVVFGKNGEGDSVGMLILVLYLSNCVSIFLVPKA